ncbi:MAG TPA: hypothetical protein VEJ45_00980 [Candidatus Acidoferrales bacterium]|nr:hypothetical protein [Candidatus Acidoferrales bacterium]
MTARKQLDAYIDELKRRLRLHALLIGCAIVAASALLTTFVLVLITKALAFSSASLAGARVVLSLIVACAVALCCVLPLLRLNRRRAASETEAAFPEFQQRLVTLAERSSDDREAFAELLAADTLTLARKAQPAIVVPNKKLLVSLGAALGAAAVLIWMIVAGPGYLGYGAALLWMGDAGAAPLYDIHVSPGDATVRRNADQLVTVQPRGIQVTGARIYARYESTTKWEQLSMQPQPGASGFQFLFAGIPEGVEYYVEAGPLRSRHFKIRVTDMPSVKQIRVTYRYPPWTGMGPVVEERGGDLRAIEGTEANLEITMDRALGRGVLILDDDRQISLSHATGNVYQATIRIAKDGSYHLAALDRDQSVRISEDYFIEASKADPPDLVISKPAGDYRASPIEEVTVSVRADDAFGLNDLGLHYSVNGGPERTVDLLKRKGDKTADASTTISLEDFKVVPGDVISVYATAKDAHAESRTDLFFIQAEPFEREYSQSQQMGGGAGGGVGNAPDEISQRQKEIIGATWKQLGDKQSAAERAAENAKFLSGVQSKLREQAISLAGRLEMRGLIAENDEFTGFQKDMNAAAEAMGPASQKLQQQKWKEALPDEQKALEYLLRAEATFRQIQVAFGNAGAGAAGGSGSAGRDLASLFDLELDTQKNQYETAQTANSQAQRDQQIDEALRKLDELARRQDELASQNKAQTPQQRWQQEMLRREAEQLQRQIEELSRNNQMSAAQGGPSSGPSQSGESGSASDPRVQRALNQLRQAGEDMRRASSQPQSQADARRAAERLREATNLLGSAQRQHQSGRLDTLAGEAERLASEQRKQSDRIHAMANGQRDAASESPESLADDRQRLADDLSSVEKQLRDAVRDLSSNDRAAASKLRDALRELDQSDLDTRIQRSADWLRRGINPDRNGSESEIGSGLQKLSQQVREAQQAAGNGDRDGSKSALDQVENLRMRLEALSRDGGNASGARQSERAGSPTGAGATGNVGDFVHDLGGAYGGPVYGAMNTGNNRYYGQLPSPPSADTAPIPPERAYRESVAELDRLRQTVKDDPESLRQVQELIREMQGLDPSRFPGNPAIVERLRSQVLSDVDKLELQLRRDSEGKQAGEVRNSESLPIPAGYEEAVAAYYRRLSNRPE